MNESASSSSSASFLSTNLLALQNQQPALFDLISALPETAPKPHPPWNEAAFKPLIDSGVQAFMQGKWLLILAGVPPLPALFQWINFLNDKHRGEPRGILLLIENPAVLHEQLSSFDWSGLIENGRVLFCLGPDWNTSIPAVWKEHRIATLDAKQLGYVAITQAPPRIAQIIQETHESERKAYFQLLSECETYWSKSAQSITRVWTQTNNDRAAGGILLGLVEGFAALGLETRSLFLTDTLFTRFYRCAFDFYHHKPDLMVCVNHSSDYVASFAQPVPIPRLVYYVDHPDRTVEVPFHAHDLCIGVSETFRDAVEKRNGTYLGEIAVAAPPTIVVPEESIDYRHEVTYVGTVMETVISQKKLKPLFLEWMEAIIEKQLDDSRIPLLELIQQSPLDESQLRELTPVLRDNQPKARFMSDERLIEYTLNAEANSRRRLEAITHLSGISGLAIYGPDAWLTRLSDESLRSAYRGPIDTARDLFDLYRHSKINLSINSLHGFSFVNQRLFEVPAAGGFLLAEQIPGIEAYFVRDEEMAWFDSWDDMREQIPRWLKSDTDRTSMIQSAQQRIQNEHTYKQRAQTALRWVEQASKPHA